MTARLLAVETATPWQSVAVLGGEEVLSYEELEVHGAHAKSLLVTIDRVLHATHMTLQDVDGLAVSIGPGSFTGLRVGLAAMLGLRSVTGLPLVTVPTLEAMAWNLGIRSGKICPMVWSRKDEVYWAVYEWTAEGTVTQVLAPQVGSPALAAQDMSSETVVFGNGWDAIREQALYELSHRTVVIEEVSGPRGRPSAVGVARAALRRFAEGAVAEASISPLYVQRAEAERVFERRGEESALDRRKRRLDRARGARGPRSTRGVPSDSVSTHAKGSRRGQ